MKLAIFGNSKRPKELSLEDATAQVNKWINIQNASSDNATIDIDGEIGEDWLGAGINTLQAVKSKLKEISGLKAKTITVNISSLGGSVNHGLGIHDVLAAHKATIITDVKGLTASMGTVIAQAGDTRKISDNALYLIHQPWGMFMSNVTELEQDLEDMKSVNNRLVNIYVKRSGQPEDKIRELMNEANGNGKWIDAEEAKEMGLIDEIYEPMKAAAMVLSPEANSHMRLPEIPKIKNNVTEDDNNSQILNTMKELKDMFAGLTAFIAASFKKEGSEESTVPENIQDKITEIEAQIVAVGGQEARVTELEAEAVTAAEALAASTTGLDASAAELAIATARIATLESELAKANGQSTKTPGKTGLEDADNPADKTAQMLATDLATIKAELV